MLGRLPEAGKIQASILMRSLLNSEQDGQEDQLGVLELVTSDDIERIGQTFESFSYQR